MNWIERDRISHVFLIDMTYLILIVVGVLLSGLYPDILAIKAFTMGLGVGSMIHIAEKWLTFQLILEESVQKEVKTEAKERVKKEAQQTVKTEVEEQMDEQVKEMKDEISIND